jgi:hypothetical protein
MHRITIRLKLSLVKRRLEFDARWDCSVVSRYDLTEAGGRPRAVDLSARNFVLQMKSCIGSSHSPAPRTSAFCLRPPRVEHGRVAEYTCDGCRLWVTPVLFLTIVLGSRDVVTALFFEDGPGSAFLLP